MKYLKDCANIPCSLKIQLIHSRWYRGKFNNRNIVMDNFNYQIFYNRICSVKYDYRFVGNENSTKNSVNGTITKYSKNNYRLIGLVKNGKMIYFETKNYGPWIPI